MSLSRHHSGMRGVYLVASELSRLGFTVSPTARNAAGADLLVFDPSTAHAASIDVKTNAKKAPFWLVGDPKKRRCSRSHFFAFVNISIAPAGGDIYDYYLIPSQVVVKRTIVQRSSTGSMWYSFTVKAAEKYRDAWAQLHAVGPTI